MSALYTSSLSIFVSSPESSKVFGHRNVGMMLICVGFKRQGSVIERTGVERVRGGES